MSADLVALAGWWARDDVSKSHRVSGVSRLLCRVCGRGGVKMKSEVGEETWGEPDV